MRVQMAAAEHGQLRADRCGPTASMPLTLALLARNLLPLDTTRQSKGFLLGRIQMVYVPLCRPCTLVRTTPKHARMLLFLRKLRTICQSPIGDLRYELKSNRSIGLTPHIFTSRTGSSYSSVTLPERRLCGNKSIQCFPQLTAICVQTRHRPQNSLDCPNSRLQCTHARPFLRETPCPSHREHEATYQQEFALSLPSPLSFQQPDQAASA